MQGLFKSVLYIFDLNGGYCGGELHKCLGEYWCDLFENIQHSLRGRGENTINTLVRRFVRWVDIRITYLRNPNVVLYRYPS
jgi:hypothetical protein